MHRRADGLGAFSASDLAGHVALSFLTSLERAAIAGQLERPRRREDTLDVPLQRGLAHEARYLAELRSQGVAATDVTFDRAVGSARIEAPPRATEEATLLVEDEAALAGVVEVRNLSTRMRQRWFEFRESPRRRSTPALVG